MGLFDVLLENIFKVVVYAFKSAIRWVCTSKGSKWPLVEATITAPPLSLSGAGGLAVELVYSYRFNGELYTGLHEEVFLLKSSGADYITRFGEGRSIVVRVNTVQPEDSVVREDDQNKLAAVASSH